MMKIRCPADQGPNTTLKRTPASGRRLALRYVSFGDALPIEAELGQIGGITVCPQ